LILRKIIKIVVTRSLRGKREEKKGERGRRKKGEKGRRVKK